MGEAVRQNETGKTVFEWTAKSEEAAVLLAEDKLTDNEISARLEIGRATLARWKEHTDFEARVKAHVAVFARRVMQNGIARIDRRVGALQDRWERLQRVIDARAEEHADVPGGSTGLLVRQMKALGGGPSAQIVEEYAVDTGLLKEMREHEKQAAQELGQWTEKHEVTTPDVSPDDARRELLDLLFSRGDRSGNQPSPGRGPAASASADRGGVPAVN